MVLGMSWSRFAICEEEGSERGEGRKRQNRKTMFGFHWSLWVCVWGGGQGGRWVVMSVVGGGSVSS